MTPSIQRDALSQNSLLAAIELYRDMTCRHSDFQFRTLHWKDNAHADLVEPMLVVLKKMQQPIDRNLQEAIVEWAFDTGQTSLIEAVMRQTPHAAIKLSKK